MADTAVSKNEQTVNDFIAAFGKLDIEGLMGFFTEDAVYHNMPWPPATGKAAIRKVLESFTKDMGMTSAKFEVRFQVCKGNIVMNERVDHLGIKDKKIGLPVFGVFEVENGKIKAWRDYFDAETFNKELAAA
ncbi:MAG: limonene-1,2-epoxide hydrolase [Alphaproteobacteria bacterium]|nr:limonene-1,2-epoxide hydrolase [Alphaproteobacteria bacterium]